MIEEDKDILDLLENLSKYNLLLEQLQNSMRDGYSNLSRANYHNKDSIRGRYGKDYWDYSYTGNKTVKVDLTSGEDTISIFKTKLLNSDSIEIKEDDQSSSNTIIDEKNDNVLKNRKEKTTSKTKTSKSSNEVKPVIEKNPITMFGSAFTIPQSLRDSQTNFESIIPLLQELINTKNKINKITNDAL
ncbi:hypothetical protein TPHA_0D01930 [Tetrapisispora phaffii CBS 4417]|uniref:Vacuolar ATPase assembly protein VMA22 n=1 Tax=Tetrapisispora phaffii (strain ATCC 24235 / CBS 4417 / NBRC 1672 / NRRL Y-8282 / UCD 70-5) TaxID=1071381 RepID=G8BSL1_TETPH|nr:hypothetical protein TPHA_0D01930 [Tetrapisispora phaffii CBS 4417]CCE62832.1 hypothetical protein TPHA_0D01930 [Tetrapisispora phaffii CBS 4417]